MDQIGHAAPAACLAGLLAEGVRLAEPPAEPAGETALGAGFSAEIAEAGTQAAAAPRLMRGVVVAAAEGVPPGDIAAPEPQACVPEDADLSAALPVLPAVEADCEDGARDVPEDVEQDVPQDAGCGQGEEDEIDPRAASFAPPQVPVPVPERLPARPVEPGGSGTAAAGGPVAERPIVAPGWQARPRDPQGRGAAEREMRPPVQRLDAGMQARLPDGRLTGLRASGRPDANESVPPAVTPRSADPAPASPSALMAVRPVSAMPETMRTLLAGQPAGSAPSPEIAAEAAPEQLFGTAAVGGPPTALPAATGPAQAPLPASWIAEGVARQVTDAVLRLRDDRIEIALSPEELGSVRLVLTRGEAGLSMTVWVERPDVLETLRRQAETMLADLRGSGFGEASLTFRDGSDGQGRQDAWGDATDANEAGAPTGRQGGAVDPAEPQGRPMATGRGTGLGRLDIRV